MIPIGCALPGAAVTVRKGRSLPLVSCYYYYDIDYYYYCLLTSVCLFSARDGSIRAGAAFSRLLPNNRQPGRSPTRVGADLPPEAGRNRARHHRLD